MSKILIVKDRDGNVFKDDPSDVVFHGEAAELVTFEIPRGVTAIRAGAFAKLPELEKVIIPASVTFVEGGAFSNCKNLKKIVFAEGRKPIEVQLSCFNGCTKLKSILFPKRLKKLTRLAEAHCPELCALTFLGNTKIYMFDGFFGGNFEKIDEEIGEDVTIRAFRGTMPVKFAKKYGFAFEEFAEK